MICTNLQVFLWYYTPLELALGFSYFEMAKLLLLAGCKCTNPIYFENGKAAGSLTQVPWLQLREEVLQFRNLPLSEAKDMFNWLVTHMTNPIRLKQACRIVIRRHMTNSLPLLKHMERLPLPPLLKGYLLFQDFAHIG